MSVDHFTLFLLLTTRLGEEYTAKYCILAVPPLHLQPIEFIPALPEDKLQFICMLYSCVYSQCQAQLHMGKILKVLVRYEENFWRRRGLSGEMMSNQFPLLFSLEYSEDTIVCYVVGKAVDTLRHLSEPVKCSRMHLANFLTGAKSAYLETFGRAVW